MTAETLNSRKEEMAQMYSSGMTYQKIGEKFGITKQRVEQIIKKNPRLSTRVKRPALVAREVKRLLAENKPVVMAKILRQFGYSETVATVPANVTEMKSYREEMDPYVDRLTKHREKVLRAMEAKDLNEEQYRTLADSSTKLTHDIQLLSGGKTENIGLEESRKVLVAILAEIRQ